jgi:hypothetical protein
MPGARYQMVHLPLYIQLAQAPRLPTGRGIASGAGDGVHYLPFHLVQNSHQPMMGLQGVIIKASAQFASGPDLAPVSSDSAVHKSTKVDFCISYNLHAMHGSRL